MATPAGWYPDPGHAGPPPPAERWWDGQTWTAHTRPPDATIPAPAPVPQPTYAQPPIGPYAAAPPYGYGYPQGPPTPRTPRSRSVVVLAAVLVVALVVAAVGYVTLSGDGDGDGGRDEADGTRGTVTTAQAGGVALPLLDGWTEADVEGGVMISADPYPCPGDTEQQCIGGAASLGVLPQATDSPEELARADIELHAEDGYGSDELYSGVTGVEETDAEEVTVLGQDGFRVRARVETGVGMDAVVESVAFPAPDGSGLALLRLAFDVRDTAPPVEDMARVLSGLRASGSGPGTEV
ncbi:DUF2510 domain-containing protein [Streptomyces avicenniae]|uniref:DUF2510 domain-containing protein n=1 Tax=Streptomyces avicenniae TaxID=500153 RepID=UPI0006993065|nr:DUF2510 domain-containing protein [Streptomyces avicenniae]